MNVGNNRDPSEEPIKNNHLPIPSQENLQHLEDFKAVVNKVKVDFRVDDNPDIEKPNEKHEIKLLNEEAKQHKVEQLRNLNNPSDNDIEDFLDQHLNVESSAVIKEDQNIERTAPIEQNVDLPIRAEDVAFVAFLDEEKKHIDLEPVSPQSLKKMDEKPAFLMGKDNRAIVREQDKAKVDPILKREDIKDWKVVPHGAIGSNAVKQFKERLKNNEAFKNAKYMTKREFQVLSEDVTKRFLEQTKGVSKISSKISFSYVKGELTVKFEFLQKFTFKDIDGKEKESEKPMITICINALKKLGKILKDAQEKHDRAHEVIDRFVQKNLQELEEIITNAAVQAYQLKDMHSLTIYEDILKQLEQRKKITPEAPEAA